MRYLSIAILSVLTLGGCATGGLSKSETSLPSAIQLKGEPPQGMVRVIAYRKTSMGMAMGVAISLDGLPVLSLGHNRYDIFFTKPGSKEVTVDHAGNVAKCLKNVFIPPNQTTYLKIADSQNYSTGLMVIAPILGLIKDSQDEKTSRCGGTTEPFLVDELTAQKEISPL